MRHKSLRSLGIAAGAILLAAGVGQHDGLGILIQQIRIIGPRQWLGLMAGSLVPAAPLAGRIARLLPGRAVAAAGRDARVVATA